MDILEETKIDWFKIDLEAFEIAYFDCLCAVEECREFEAQYWACFNGECTHDRKLKKDGTPNKRYRCPFEGMFYNKWCDARNGLNYYHHYDLFKAIGLIQEDDAHD